MELRVLETPEDGDTEVRGGIKGRQRDRERRRRGKGRKGGEEEGGRKTKGPDSRRPESVDPKDHSGLRVPQ